MMTDLYDRKLDFWEMFGVSWKIFRNQFKFIFIILLGLYAVSTALSRLFIYSGLNEHWAVKAFGISNLFGFIGPLVVIAIVGQTLKEQSMSWTTIWQSVRPILLSALFIKLIFLIAFLPSQLISTHVMSSSPVLRLGMRLIAAIFGFFFMLTYQALFFRRKRGFSAFIYSFQTVKGSWWKLFAVGLLFGLPMMILLLATSPFEPEFVIQVLMPLGHLFFPVFAVLSGYFTIFYTLFFLNIVRHDVRFAEKVGDDLSGSQ